MRRVEIACLLGDRRMGVAIGGASHGFFRGEGPDETGQRSPKWIRFQRGNGSAAIRSIDLSTVEAPSAPSYFGAGLGGPDVYCYSTSAAAIAAASINSGSSAEALELAFAFLRSSRWSS